MSKEVIRNERFFLRPKEDFEAGSMTSLHSRITLEGDKLRGQIFLRDCDSEISFEFWAGEGARPGGKQRCMNMIAELQDELSAFALDFVSEAIKLGDKDE